MNSDEVTPDKLKAHPNNKNWTTPRSFGVWELPDKSSGKKYRFGNNPVRETELVTEFGSAKLLALYLSRESAREHANKLNNAASK